MLHNRRSIRSCKYGCCSTRTTNRTLRTREKNAWKRDAR